MKEIEVEETEKVPIIQASKDSNNKIKKAKFNVLMKNKTNTTTTITASDRTKINKLTKTKETPSRELKANVKFQVQLVSILKW